MGIIGSWLENARLEVDHFSCGDMNRGPFTTGRAVTSQAYYSTQIYILQVVSLLGVLTASVMIQ